MPEKNQFVLSVFNLSSPTLLLIFWDLCPYNAERFTIDSTWDVPVLRLKKKISINVCPWSLGLLQLQGFVDSSPWKSSIWRSHPLLQAQSPQKYILAQATNTKKTFKIWFKHLQDCHCLHLRSESASKKGRNCFQHIKPFQYLETVMYEYRKLYQNLCPHKIIIFLWFWDQAQDDVENQTACIVPSIKLWWIVKPNQHLMRDLQFRGKEEELTTKLILGKLCSPPLQRHNVQKEVAKLQSNLLLSDILKEHLCLHKIFNFQGCLLLKQSVTLCRIYVTIKLVIQICTILSKIVKCLSLKSECLLKGFSYSSLFSKSVRDLRHSNVFQCIKFGLLLLFNLPKPSKSTKVTLAHLWAFMKYLTNVIKFQI